MEKHVPVGCCRGFVACSLAIILFPFVATGGGLKEAKLTSRTGDVKLSTENSILRPALPNEALEKSMGVTTGANSRAELVFKNHVVARLSPETVLNFKGDLELVQGAVLIQAPGGSKGKTHAGDVAVDVSNATAIIEHQAPAFKFLVLDGTVRLYRPAHLGDSI